MQITGSPAICYRARSSALDESFDPGGKCFWRFEKRPQVQAFSDVEKNDYSFGNVFLYQAYNLKKYWVKLQRSRLKKE